MISNNLNNILSTLMSECENAIFCISSGSHKSSLFKTILDHKNKITTLIIGTNNFSTTPIFLEEFINKINTTLIISNTNYTKKDTIFNVNLYMFFMNDNSWILVNSSTGIIQDTKAVKFLNMNSIIDSEDLDDEDKNQTMNTFITSIKDYLTIGESLTTDSYENYKKLFTTHYTYINNYTLEDLTSTMLKTSKKLASKIHPLT